MVLIHPSVYQSELLQRGIFYWMLVYLWTMASPLCYVLKENTISKNTFNIFLFTSVNAINPQIGGISRTIEIDVPIRCLAPKVQKGTWDCEVNKTSILSIWQRIGIHCFPISCKPSSYDIITIRAWRWWNLSWSSSHEGQRSNTQNGAWQSVSLYRRSAQVCKQLGLLEFFNVTCKRIYFTHFLMSMEKKSSWNIVKVMYKTLAALDIILPNIYSQSKDEIFINCLQ